MDEVQITIGELLAAGWTLSSIADEIETHRETVSRWNSGRANPEHPRLVLGALDSLKSKKAPPKRRYPDGHYLQRRARGEDQPGER